jgi:hypothetical protein
LALTRLVGCLGAPRFTLEEELSLRISDDFDAFPVKEAEVAPDKSIVRKAATASKGIIGNLWKECDVDLQM